MSIVKRIYYVGLLVSLICNFIAIIIALVKGNLYVAINISAILKWIDGTSPHIIEIIFFALFAFVALEFLRLSFSFQKKIKTKNSPRTL